MEVEKQLSTANAFAWQKQMRFYHYSEELDVNKAVLVKMADAVIPYGFEYLGIPDRLVQTPLTDKCYLILTQAIHAQCGGSPFGPAGTGQQNTRTNLPRCAPNALTDSVLPGQERIS
jgi:dynein heavy chain 1